MEPADAPAEPTPPRRWEPLAAAVCAAASLAWYWKGQYRGVRMSDDFEYAHIARNILRGRGFETQQLNPIDLGHFAGVPHANVLHPPGTPLLIAPSFALFGVSDFAAVLPMAACFVALAAVVFLVASRLFGRAAGWCAAGLFAIHPETLRYATVAMSELPTALCMTAAVLAALVAGPDPSKGRRALFAAGLLCGAAMWFRENAATFGGAVLVFVLAQTEGDLRTKLRRCVPVVAGLAVPAALLSLRCMIAFGKPWFSYSTYALQCYSPLFDGVEIYRHIDPPTFLESLRAHPDVFRAKVVKLVLDAPLTFAAAAWMPCTVLLAAHLVLPARRAAAATLAALGAALALHFAAHAVFAANPRHVVPYVPLVTVFAGATVATVVCRLVHRRRDVTTWVTALVVAVLVAAAVRHYRIYALSDWRTNQWDGIGAWVAKETPEGALVATDQFEPVVWYADRRAMVLPVDRAGFDEMVRRADPGWLMVTSRASSYPKLEWVAEIAGAPAANGWHETGRFDDGKVRAVLYARVR